MIDLLYENVLAELDFLAYFVYIIEDDDRRCGVMSRFTIIQGDITSLKVDAIVNAANTSLLGGGGVDGAIHRAAGPQLLAECKQAGGCLTGHAKKTRGYNLPIKWVIHTVGPVWQGGSNNEEVLLADCYRNSLALAAELGVETIAFPSISTGAYGFPLDRAARIAVREITEFLQSNLSIKQVMMVAFDSVTYEAYQEALNKPTM